MSLVVVAWLAATSFAGVVAENAVQAPEVTAQSVFAFDPATNEVILEVNPDERLLIGSVTKVATALVVVDHADLDDKVVISGTDMVEPGFSAMGLQPGDTLTVQQLLTGLLVVSGGDAARALARHVGSEMTGNEDAEIAIAAFVDAMNDKAAELELANTQFANPDGEDSEDAWSSARDVAYLYAALEDHPELAELSALPDFSLTSVGPEQTPYSGISTNQLIGQHNVISAKTGSTQEAGGCIVLSRDNPTDDGKEIVAILGSTLEYDETTWIPTIDERWNDAVSVMDSIDANWTPGQNIVAEVATEEPVAAAPEQSANDSGVPAKSQPRTLTLAENDPGVAPSSRTEPFLVLTVAGSVLALAGVFSWSRVLPPRS